MRSNITYGELDVRTSSSGTCNKSMIFQALRIMQNTVLAAP